MQKKRRENAIIKYSLKPEKAWGERGEKRKKQVQQAENSFNMVHFTPNISIITLNVNVLNTTIKSQRLSE